MRVRDSRRNGHLHTLFAQLAGAPQEDSEPSAKLARAMEDGGHAVSPGFGALLRRYRLAAGLSQEALAERAALSPYGISALERGYRRTPQRETVQLLAGALALNGEQRRALETAAARAASPRRRDGAAVTLGPWPSIGPAKLPLALTRFVGRGDELDEIAALLREHRLVTITGAGGVGKTQTALRAAMTASDAGRTSVSFVSLAPIGDPSLVTTVIANALGVQEVPNHLLIETLVAFLKNKSVLVLLDNCEHVIAEAATVADYLLHACPTLRILATSREPLRAAGERTYRLPSLEENDATMLFADRAQAADVHFALTDENRPIVGEICRHLGGIPLAIELAAARVTVMPLQALAKALDDRLQLLSEGERTSAPRQQTMRAAIDWSYELLTACEQQLFERLSIFAGGCTLGAARTVCEGDGIKTDDVLPLISSLVSKSLVVADVAGYEPRYRLLEPFREYAREKLKLHGEQQSVALRHAFAYLDLAEWFGSPAVRSGQVAIYYGHPHDEIGNWRIAVQWALAERGNVLLGQRLVALIVRAWGAKADVLSDARRWIPMAINLIDSQTPVDVVALLRLAEAYLAMHIDNHTLQIASAQSAIAYFRKADDRLNLMRALTIAGNALFDLGRVDEARAVLEESLGIARVTGSRWHIAFVSRNLGACLDTVDVIASRTYLTEALQLLEALDDQGDIEAAAIDFASLAFNEGDPELAVRHIAELFINGREPHSRQIAVLARVSVSQYLIALGRYEEAQEYARDALAAAREEHFDVYAAHSLGRLATIAALRATSATPDAHASAARILGFVEARLKTLGSAAQDHEPMAALLRKAIGTNTFKKLMAEGAAMTEEEAVEAAISL